MKHLKIFEEYSKFPPIYSGQEYVKNDDGTIYITFDNFMGKIFFRKKDDPGNILKVPINDFRRDFTKVEKITNVISPKKDKYVNYDNEAELDFNSSTYLSDEKAIVGAYMITKNEDKYIEVLNIKEYENQNGAFMDSAIAYSVSIHKEKLPKSQIEIMSPVSDKDNFFYVKIPYWLFKEKPGLAIKRCKTDKKRISISDAGFRDKELMNMFNDPDVTKYFKYSNPDSRTLQLIELYKKRKTD